MEDFINCSFRATKESCILTSLAYLLNYIANKQGDIAPTVESVFWTYIEYYRHTHMDNGLSGKKLVDWAKGRSFSKKQFPIESKKIEKDYKNTFPGYNHIGKSCAELLSTIMLHWVCAEENHSCNQGTGKRGYDEVLDFLNYCKINEKYKELLNNVEIVGHKTSKISKYNLEVETFLSNEDTIGLVLYSAQRGSHSICIYKQGENYIVRDPNKDKISNIDLGTIDIREYIMIKLV